MKAAEDGRRYDAAHVLDRAIYRSVLVERPMSRQLIIIGGVFRQNPACVLRQRFAHVKKIAELTGSGRAA
jgi:hypothetical protein